VKHVIEDLQELEAQGQFNYDDLDVITFAGSGEPSIAKNLGEMILAIRELYKDRLKQVPISILTNATMLNDPDIRKRVLEAELISLKLDAPNDEILRAVNQPAPGITMASITSGIKALRKELYTSNALYKAVFQLQMMFMPKFIAEPSYIQAMANLIQELGINKLQINTPTREKPVSKTGEYWIDTRGNHYSEEQAGHIKPEYIEFKHLPVISKEEAFSIEDRLRELLHDSMPELEIVNVYKRD
jgi:wyosine [tRNA(Phe)-imidazoG37] synthetase (radical SAM superfamily)